MADGEKKKKDTGSGRLDSMDHWRAETKRVFGTVPKTHNCAQAVAEIVGRTDLVPTMAACGGGRAPHGYCGALHAALAVTSAADHEAVMKEFAENVGALTCREITGTAKTPCDECVAFGAALAMKNRS